VYLASEGKEQANGVHSVVGPTHDITDAVEQFVKMNPDWVMEALFGKGVDPPPINRIL
jgi:hypothetical protein